MLLSLCEQERDKNLDLSILSADSEIYIIMDVTIYLPRQSSFIISYCKHYADFNLLKIAIEKKIIIELSYSDA